MFGLSKQEILINAVKNACINALPHYDAAIKEFVEAYTVNPEMPEAQVNALIQSARREYLNAVCDNVWNSLAVSSPVVDNQFRIAITNPEITGLPSEFSIDYLCDNGISAGVVFACAYFALTRKEVSGAKSLKIMSMLNHYQNDLMNTVLLKYDNN